MEPTTNNVNSIGIIMGVAEDCVSSVYHHIQMEHMLTPADGEYMEKLFVEYGKRIPFLSHVLAEKGICAFLSGDPMLGSRMFADAVSIDTPENSYWQSYYYLGLTQYTMGDTDSAKGTFKKLSLKNPDFLKDAPALNARFASFMSADTFTKLGEFIKGNN